MADSHMGNIERNHFTSPKSMKCDEKTEFELFRNINIKKIQQKQTTKKQVCQILLCDSKGLPQSIQYINKQLAASALKLMLTYCLLVTANSPLFLLSLNYGLNFCQKLTMYLLVLISSNTIFQRHY